MGHRKSTATATQSDLSYFFSVTPCDPFFLISRFPALKHTDVSDGEWDEEDVEHEADWEVVQKPRRKKRQV